MNKPTSDKYISGCRISGLVVLAFAVIFVIVGVVMNANSDTYSPNNMYPGYTFGAISLVLLLISVKDPKTKTASEARKKAKLVLQMERNNQAEYEKRMSAYYGIFLTEQQILQLENEKELPVVDTPVLLRPDEVAVYYCKAMREATKGPNHAGELVLTTKRLIFLSEQKGFEVPYNAITTATAYTNALTIQSRGRSYTLFIPKPELAATAFDAVLAERISSANVKIFEGDDSDIYEEIAPNDIALIDGMEGHEFEYFCANLLRKSGFLDVNVTKGSGDQGVDILAVKDGIKYSIQCKNYATALGNTPIQEVNAGKTYYNCHVGVVMTNSTFTPGAKALAQATGVLLWDRSTLQKMLEDVE